MPDILFQEVIFSLIMNTSEVTVHVLTLVLRFQVSPILTKQHEVTIPIPLRMSAGVSSLV